MKFQIKVGPEINMHNHQCNLVITLQKKLKQKSKEREREEKTFKKNFFLNQIKLYAIIILRKRGGIKLHNLLCLFNTNIYIYVYIHVY